MRFTRTPLLTLAFALAFLSIAPTALASTNVTPGYITVDTTWTKAESPYIVYDPIGIPAGVTLTIEPGVVVKMGQGGCNCYVNFGISGTLIAGSASSDERVIFTSVYDDSVGGDSNGDGASTTPAAGDWRTISVAGGTLIGSHVDMKYGGLAVRPFTFFNPFYQRMLTNDSGTMLLDDVDFSFSYGDNASVRQDYNGSTTITNSRFHDAYAGFEQLNLGGTSTILGSTFSSSTVGVLAGGGTLTVASSSFTGSTYGVLNTSATYQVDARQNYWGSPTGPTNAANPSGTGAIAQGNVLFDPWLNQVPGYIPVEPTCLVDCNSNVLFFPGIMGSRLFQQDTDCWAGSEQERWVSKLDCNHAYLALNAQGKSIYPLYTKEGALGVVDDTYSLNIYQSFMGDLENWKTDGTIKDYVLIPYDWRISLEDILQNGASSTGKLSYGTSQGFQYSYIYKKLSEMAESSRTGKVTIIAHSNGGLVTKALIQKLKDTHDPLHDRIDKVILVAVPQSGTPEVVGSLLHGADIGPGGVVISAPRVRDLIHNMPFAYAQIPTEKYIGSGIPLIEFSGFSATSSFGKYGASIDTITGLYDYLNGGDGRPTPSYGDLLNAQIVNGGLLTDAHNMHTVLDNWTPASSTEVYEIAGWGLYTSMGIKYEPNKICVVSTSTIPIQPGAPQPLNCAYYQDTYKISDKLGIDGDGTVMRRSAHQMASSSNVHQYWLDLHAYGINSFDRSHKDIFEVTDLPVFLKSIVIGATKTNDNILDSISGLSIIQKVIKYEIHSPLSLSIYDSVGQHTGISTTTGLIELGVKGSSYHEIGDSKIITVPASVAHTMKLDAYDSGSFTLDIEKLDGDSVTSSTTFMGIPTSTTTKVSLDWVSGEEIGTSTKLAIDYNGDNVVDTTLVAKAGDIVLLPPPLLDLTPPATSASTTGILGTNGWYTSNALVTLTATDTESGVATTSYSLNGSTWLTYTAPLSFTTEGTTTVLYYSVDKAGNREATSTLILKIDRNAPEANISVSTSTQDILVEGVDNFGITSVAKDSSGNVTVADQAGHTTKFFFTKTYTGKQLTYAKLTGVQYDNQSKITLPSSSFLYIWDTRAPVTLISQTIAVDNTYLIQATYDKSKNKTTIVVLKKNFSIQTQSFAGLKVVKLTTNKGVVGYSW